MKKRIVSVLLVLALCLAVFPAPVSAASARKQAVITDTGLSGEFVYGVGGGMGLIWQEDDTKLLIDKNGTVYRQSSSWMDVDPVSGLVTVGYDGYYKLDGGQLVLSLKQVEDNVKAFIAEHYPMGEVTSVLANYLGEFHEGYAVSSFRVVFDDNEEQLMYEVCAVIGSNGLVTYMTPLLAFTSATGYPLSWYLDDCSEGLIPYRSEYYDEADGGNLKWYEGGYMDASGSRVLTFEKENGKVYYGAEAGEKFADGDGLSYWEGYRNGYAVVENDRYMYALMDRSGRLTTPFQYTTLYNDTGRYPAAELSGKGWGYIDTAGVELIPFIYEDAKGEFNNVFTVEKNGRWGVVDLDNRTVVPFEYDFMSAPDEGIVYAVKNGKVYTMGFADAGSGDITEAGKWAVHCVFSDVPKGIWYEPYLQMAYDAGIVGGRLDGTYQPEGTLRHGEIMVIAANLHSRMKNDHYDFQGLRRAGYHWAGPFLDYCRAEGIIDDRFNDKLDDPVTREEMAYYFAHTLSDRYYGGVKPVSLTDIEGTVYKADIEKLAQSDIVGGGPGGLYRPGDTVTRAEAAVFIRNILSRIL